MTEVRDAVTWQNLQGWPGPKAGYIDGVRSVWPAEAWTALAPGPFLRISVLGNPEAEIQDCESGDQSAATCAATCSVRVGRGQWVLWYTNETDLPAAVAALRSKGLRFTDAQYWPRPAVYLFVADPVGVPHLDVPWAPVQPLMVQDRWNPGYDQSSCYGSFMAQPDPPAPTPAPAPAKPKGKDVRTIYACDGEPTTLVDGAVAVIVPDGTDVAILAGSPNTEILHVDAALAAAVAAKAKAA